MPARASDQPISTGQWRPRRVRINAARVPLGASCRAPSTDRLVADGDGGPSVAASREGVENR